MNHNFSFYRTKTLILFASISVAGHLQSFSQKRNDRDNNVAISSIGLDNISGKQDTIFFDYSLLDKYIQLAIEYSPNIKIGELKTKVAKQDVQLARYDWTNNLMGQFNLNPNNASEWGIGPKRIDPTTNLPITNAFFPLYGFTVRFTVGTFVLAPMEIKKTNELYKISLQEKENQNLLLVNEVTKRYQNYIITQKSLLIKLETETKLHSLYGFIAQSQNTKEINYLEREAQIFATYSQSLEARNLAEAELRMAKFDLEQLIGAKLESVR